MANGTKGWGGPRRGAGRPAGSKSKGGDNVVEMRRRQSYADAAASILGRARQRYPIPELRFPEIPPGVVPKGNATMAMDNELNQTMGWANSQFIGMAFGSSIREGLAFPGYAFLSVLAQRPEYRTFAETIATEMTRKWIKLKVASESKKERKKEERQEKEDVEEEEGEEGEEEQNEETEGEEVEEAEDREPVDRDRNPARDKPDLDRVDSEHEKASEGLEEHEEPENMDRERLRDEGERDEDSEADNLSESENRREGLEERDFENAAEGDLPTKEEEIERASEGEADDKTEKIKAIEDELKRLQARDIFKDVALHDAFFGVAHLFIDFENTDVDDLRGELQYDIGNGREDLSIDKCSHVRIRKLKTVEPVWTYPITYNAINPLQDDFYKPTVWYVMGRTIHASRLLLFVGRPVPDLLKPSYIFGGLSLSQLAQPYVDIWLDVRQNVANLIQAFSVMVLSTNMQGLMQPGGFDSMGERATLFNATRNNEGLMMIDKNTEEFQNVAAPLSGLHELQAQAQEHMMSVARIPAVKFTGIQPTGLNASSEGEIRVFYDTIAAAQESLFRPNLTRIIDFIQLSLFGKVDEDITFDFEPLWALSEKEEAELRKLEAETDDILVNGCAALHPEEVRERLASDPDTPYAGIDVEDVPDPPQMEGLGGKINLKGTQPFGGGGAAGGGAGGGNSGSGRGGGGGGGGFGGASEGSGEGDAAIVLDERPIIAFPRDSAGLLIEPDELSPQTQMTIDHNRERFAKHYNYADEIYGDENSYDLQGDYNCGRCNQADGEKCLLVKIAKIDRTAGSCRQWESVREGDPEMPLFRESPDLAAYGVAVNGEGFGCKRCPYSKPAKNKDDQGRRHWCGYGGFHQTPTACCALNGAETK